MTDVTMDFLRKIKKYICPFGILGHGLSGRAVEKLLLASGVKPDEILIFDQKKSLDSPVPISEAEFFSRVKTLVISPGVALTQPAIQQFLKAGGRITSELELAAEFLDSEKLIGVTGSIGKSTTTALIGEALSSFSSVFIGGNIGIPLATYALDKLLTGQKTDWITLELSSYQLENFQNLRADASVFVYLTANHLERYPNKNAYYESKWFLADRTHGPIIVNRASEELVDFVRGRDPGNRDLIPTRANDPKFDREFYKNALLLGEHNQDLFALVDRLGRELGWPTIFRKPLIEFRGLPHRLENCGRHNGVLWINDSKATALPSVVVAVESATSQGTNGGKLKVLLGGRDKGLPWQTVSHLGANPNREFIFFGEARADIQNKTQLSGRSFTTCREAIVYAKESAREGDVILLSPGGTSLDEFRSFEERGNVFKSYIGNMTKEY